MHATKRQIFLTGAPGTGKTTLVQKVCQELRSKGIALKGFYTEELRVSGTRIGFDVVSLDGGRKPLARIGSEVEGSKPYPKVGKYVVDIPSFETLAVTAITTKNLDSNYIFVLDEIGKMELYSKTFESGVQNLLKMNFVILGTIPRLEARSHPLVKYLHTNPSVQVITVTLHNRDELLSEIMMYIMSALSK